MFLQALRETMHRAHAETNYKTCERYQDSMELDRKVLLYCFNTCPVKRGVSAASFDETGLGERTGHVCRAQI